MIGIRRWRRWRRITALGISAVASRDQAWLIVHTTGRPVEIAIARAELHSLAQAILAPTNTD
mgnify:CR=1 FL=1